MADSKESSAFFFPYLTKESYVSFYGGEPLLNFPLISQAVSFLKSHNHSRDIRFSITTNGSLINTQVIDFLKKNRFTVTLSFDGFAQETQRKKGSFIPIVNLINKISRIPSIKLEVNSVFSWQNVHLLARSIKLLMDLGIRNINFSLAVNHIWPESAISAYEKEMSQLSSILITSYKKEKLMPLSDFREFIIKPDNRGICYCAAGKDRLSITPGGRIWGCFLFPEYYKQKGNRSEAKKFLFGDFTKFFKHPEKIYKKIMARYDQLNMENYSTPSKNCFLCPDIENCDICPVISAYSTSKIGRIPEFVCRLKKINIQAKKVFLKEIRSC